MKIRPCTDPPLADLGPCWWVGEADRGGIHLISLAEVMGLRRPPEASDRRTIARNHLRNLLFDTLRDGMPADALSQETGGPDRRRGGRVARLEAVLEEPGPGRTALALRPGACA